MTKLSFRLCAALATPKSTNFIDSKNAYLEVKRLKSV